jgi:hypothetical protein
MYSYKNNKSRRQMPAACKYGDNYQFFTNRVCNTPSLSLSDTS